MKTHGWKTGATTLALLALAACKEPGLDAAEPPLRTSALEAAHEAYLDGEYLALGEHVREVLTDPRASALAKENAFELLDKAYEARGGHLPSSFRLPEGFEHVTFGCIHGLGPSGPYYRVFLRGRGRGSAASRLAGVTLRREPEEVLLDKRSGKGDYKLRKEEKDFVDFVLEAPVQAPPAAGVFTIRLELDDGAVQEGWFPANAFVSTGMPTLRSPLGAVAIAETNPVVAWTPFRSPEWRPWEKQSLSVYVSRGDDHAWDFWAWEPGDLGEVRIGDHPGAARASLTPGEHWLVLAISEQRRFGPVAIARLSQRVEPFRVVAPAP